MYPLIETYDELRLRLSPRGNGSYGVLATTRTADAAGDFALPVNGPGIDTPVPRRTRGPGRTDAAALSLAKHVGGALFRAVFRDQVRDLYRDALADARGQEHGLRVTLCLSGSPELAGLPWELLYDAPHFLSLSSLTPVVRYLDRPRGGEPPQVTLPLRVLGVVSSPADYPQLDVQRERDNLERALGGLLKAGAMTLQWLARPTLSMLLAALRTSTVHALHYVGHGSHEPDTGPGVLLFEDESGWARPVSGDQLGAIVHDFSSLRLAVLNACETACSSGNDPFSGVAQSLVSRDIPAVIAMQSEISDDAAIAFAASFYDAIANGCAVDTSVAAARLSMFAERSDAVEWGTPVLFMRARDGRIFDLPEAPSQPELPVDQALTEPRPSAISLAA